MVLAVSHLVSSLWGKEEKEADLFSLNLSAPLRELLQRGVSSYILPGQEALQQSNSSTAFPSAAFEKHVSAEALRVCCLFLSPFLCLDGTKCQKSCILFFSVVSLRPVGRNMSQQRVSWFTTLCARVSLNVATLWRMKKTLNCCLKHLFLSPADNASMGCCYSMDMTVGEETCKTCLKNTHLWSETPERIVM